MDTLLRRRVLNQMIKCFLFYISFRRCAHIVVHNCSIRTAMWLELQQSAELLEGLFIIIILLFTVTYHKDVSHWNPVWAYLFENYKIA